MLIAKWNIYVPPISINDTVMMLKSILNILFFTVFLFALKSNVLAQCGSHPTVASPPIEARVDPTLSSTRTNELCNGQPLTLVTTAPTVCSGCTYLWSDGSTGPYLFVFNPGVYRVTVTDNAPNGCTGVSSQITLVSSTISLPQINGDSFNLCIDVNNTAVSNPIESRAAGFPLKLNLPVTPPNKPPWLASP